MSGRRIALPRQVLRVQDRPADLYDVPADRDEQPSKLQALLFGLGQGATLGFADELEAGIGALAPEPNTTYGERYRTRRDATRALDERTRQAHPYTFGAGELAGGAVSLVAGPGVVTQTALGAARGFGLNDSDLSTDQGRREAATDTAIGAGIGGLFAGGAKLAQKFSRLRTAIEPPPTAAPLSAAERAALIAKAEAQAADFLRRNPDLAEKGAEQVERVTRSQLKTAVGRVR